MTKTPPSKIKSLRESLGFTSGQMAQMLGLSNAAAYHRIELRPDRCGGATSMLVDIISGAIDPDNPDHDESYEAALSKLGGPTQILIRLITGEVDREKLVSDARAMRGTGG